MDKITSFDNRNRDSATSSFFLVKGRRSTGAPLGFQELHMKPHIFMLVTVLVAVRALAADMVLYDCEGQETGKVKGLVVKQQLLLDCVAKTCSVKGVHKFEAQIDDAGQVIAFAPSYFEFDPTSGKVQGVTGEPYYYFIGKCNRQK